MIPNECSVRFTTFYEANGDTILKEKTITDNAFVVIEQLMANMPNYACTERKVVDKEGNLLALEDMSDSFYGTKEWEGVDEEGNIYCKYQIGSAKDGEPALFYKYREIDGVWETDEVTIMTPNEHGDFLRIQTIIIAGYGYMESNYKYDYDQCGNWVKKYVQGGTGQFHLTATREFEYQ